MIWAEARRHATAYNVWQDILAAAKFGAMAEAG